MKQGSASKLITSILSLLLVSIDFIAIVHVSSHKPLNVELLYSQTSALIMSASKQLLKSCWYAKVLQPKLIVTVLDLFTEFIFRSKCYIKFQ